MTNERRTYLTYCFGEYLRIVPKEATDPIAFIEYASDIKRPHAGMSE